MEARIFPLLLYIPPLLPPAPPEPSAKHAFPLTFLFSWLFYRGRVRNDSFIDLVQDAIIVFLMYVEFLKIGTCQI